ncbi:Ras guanine nucleotide exchange factor [Entamoeba marina]
MAEPEDTPFSGTGEDDKKTWMEKVMKDHPEILKLAEETRTLSGVKDHWQEPTKKEYITPSFSRYLSDDVVFNPDALPEHLLIQLISQYLKEQKLTESRTAIIKEVLKKNPDIPLVQDQNTFDPSFADALEPLIVLGVTDPDNIFKTLPQTDLILPPETYDSHITFTSESTSTMAGTTVDFNNNCEILLEKYSEGETLIPAVMSVNQLVKYLINGSPRYRDKFLVIFREILSPADLLSKLLDLYSNDETLGDTVTEIILDWASKHPLDFTTPLLSRLNEASSSGLTSLSEEKLHETLKIAASNYEKFNLILRDHATLTRYFPSTTGFTSSIPSSKLLSNLRLRDLDADVIAQALCIIDFQLYNSIHPEELVSGSGENLRTALRTYSVGVEWLRQSLFAERILPDDEDKSFGLQQVREKLMDVWLKLYELCNFHSVAVFSTVFNSADNKNELESRKRGEKRKEFLATSNLFSSKNSYSTYRKRIEERVTGKQSFIPFIGITLHDVTSIRSGLESYLGDGLVNFLKFNSIYNCIEQFELYKKFPYQVAPVAQVISLILRGMSEVEFMVGADN